MSEEVEVKKVHEAVNAPRESAEDKEIKRLEIEAKKLELEIKRRQLEALDLEQQERTYHIKDLKQRLEERDTREKQLTEDREQQGRTFAQQRTTDNYRYSICTHRKGGVVTPRDMRVLHTGGNKEQFAVIKHQMINGDIWVRCLRCGKTWNPPVEKNFYFNSRGESVAKQDGKFDAARFNDAQEKYIAATMLNTNNSMSTSVQVRFSRIDPESKKIIDAADVYRENIASTTLR